MKSHTTISIYDFSNFLKAGAVFRQQGYCFLLWDFVNLNTHMTTHLNTHLENDENNADLNTLHAPGENLDTSEISVVYSDFFDSSLNMKKLIPQQVAKLSCEELALTCRKYLNDSSRLLTQIKFWQPPDKQEFLEDFDSIKSRIDSGQIDKAVPIQLCKTKWVPSELDRARMILNLLNAPDNLHVFGHWSPDSDSILGATPEVLFRIDENQLSTMALAGSLPKSPISHTLLSNIKERKEHQYVIDDIISQLSAFGDPEVGETQVIHLPQISHLKTEINLPGNFLEKNKDLVSLLHPTSALGVFPRNGNDNLLWLKTLNSQADRKYFGAPWIIQLSPQNIIALVSIRSIQWNKDGSSIGSGCGIVKESVFESEWEELQYKRESVMKILGLINEEC